MLKNKFISFKFTTHIKSGFYIDYLWRLLAKKYLQNVFIWGALYVSEKFVIEYLTRFIVNNSKNLLLSAGSPITILTFTVQWLVLLGLLALI